MAKVNLHLLNIFYLKTNKKLIEYEGKTVGVIISKFIKDYNEKLDNSLLSKNRKKLDSQILVLVNGRNIKYLKKDRTKLTDGDNIHISVPMAGG